MEYNLIIDLSGSYSAALKRDRSGAFPERSPSDGDAAAPSIPGPGRRSPRAPPITLHTGVYRRLRSDRSHRPATWAVLRGQG